MQTEIRISDLVRSIALGTSAAAVVGVPTLGPLMLRTRENTESYDTAITPPGYAFTIWAPIFAGIVANAGQSALPNRLHLPENRRTGWLLAGAYALNTAWSVASQADRFRYTPVLLPAAVVLTGEQHRTQRGSLLLAVRKGLGFVKCFVTPESTTAAPGNA